MSGLLGTTRTWLPGPPRLPPAGLWAPTGNVCGVQRRGVVPAGDAEVDLSTLVASVADQIRHARRGWWLISTRCRSGNAQSCSSITGSDLNPDGVDCGNRGDEGAMPGSVIPRDWRTVTDGRR
jgi:hypothetical protein